LGASGSSSADAAEQEKATINRQTAAGAGAGTDQRQLVRTETRDSRPASRQNEMARSLMDSPPRMQCNPDLCAARYKSFNAADCTYQPYGGGPRSRCEVSAPSADAPRQTSRVATDARSEAKDTQLAETAAETPKSAISGLAGPQCNVELCAARYRSFNAADCTYQPYGGGPRSTCEQ
jgi:hypothetical protein